jgi:hypothetical protein
VPFVLSVTCEPSMLSVLMLNVVMLSVVGAGVKHSYLAHC